MNEVRQKFMLSEVITDRTTSSLCALGSASYSREGVSYINSLFGAGLYRNASGEMADFTSLAKFNPNIGFAEQGNLSRAFNSYRSLGSRMTIASRVFGGAVLLWDYAQYRSGKAPIQPVIGDAHLIGMAEVPFLGPPMAVFLWLNSFIPESPSSNFANPGRTPGYYAEWLH